MNVNIPKRHIPLIVVLFLTVLAFATGLHERISLAYLQDHKETLLHTVEQHPALAALAFMGAYTGVVALSLPIAAIFTLAGGFLFGKWLGTLYAVSAATFGSTIIFLIAKTSLGEALREKAGSIYKSIEKNMKENAAGYLLFMRLVPVFPFFLVNIVAAIFNVSLRTFVLTTFFGIIPGGFVFANAGEQLGTIEKLADLVSTEMLLAFALLGGLVLLPTIYKQLTSRI
jgi:uncharacterized membrane protein YdjX (TVP38/TMEM64 family)